MFVTPHATENNVILLTALERIDTGNLDFLVQILAITPVLLHRADDIRPLTFIRSDNTDLTRLNPRLEKLGDNLLTVRGLRTKLLDYPNYWEIPIEEGCSACADFFLTQITPENHG